MVVRAQESVSKQDDCEVEEYSSGVPEYIHCAPTAGPWCFACDMLLAKERTSMAAVVAEAAADSVWHSAIA